MNENGASPHDGVRPHDGVPASGRVLVVDDVPANVRLLAGILKMADFEVVTAGGGAEALQALESQPLPDIILLDIMMPDIDGFEVCRRIRDTPATQYLPVVMVTALHEGSARISALEFGADDLLSKPVDEVEVVARVKSLVRIKRSRDELTRAYEELRRVEEMRDNMTAMLIHDLRTPLTSMIMPLEMLREREVDDSPEMRQELAEVAARSAHRLLGMINDLLDISKMEAGEMKLDVAPMEILPLIEEAFEQINPLCADTRVEVRREVASEIQRFEADDDLLRRVIVNLLGNAIRFAPTGSVVTVRAQLERDFAGWAESRILYGSSLPDLREAVVFSVSDEGQGIAPEDQARIWDKFAQVDLGHRGGRRRATGLGLTFCKLVAEAHGGGIWVESIPGNGATFWFALPLHPQYAATEPDVVTEAG